MKKLFFLLFIGFGFTALNAQETEIIKNVFKGTRLVNGQSANLVEKGKLNLAIQHRFGDISGGFYELFGLDQASMRIGFEYGFTDNFNLGIGRSTFLKTYDGFAKYSIIQQNYNFPFTIIATAEGSVPTLRNYFPDNNDKFSDKFAGLFQFHLAKTIKNFGFQLSPGFLKTGYLNSENTSLSMFTLGTGGSLKISNKVSINVEYLYNFKKDFSNIKPLSVGIDLDTGGHLFQLVLSNSQQMFGQGLYTYSNGDWTTGNLFFGFNLIREFKLKYY